MKLRYKNKNAAWEDLIFAMCAKSLRFFIFGCEEWGWEGVKGKDAHALNNPIHGLPKFEYLWELAPLWEEEEILVVAKSRQMTISWFFAACHTWDVGFHEARQDFYISEKLLKAHDLVNRSGFIYRKLPEFMRERVHIPKGDKYDCSAFAQLDVPDMGSFITGLGQGITQLNQYTVSRILFDEAALQADLAGTYGEAYPAITGGGRMAANSTPRGNDFFKLLYRGEKEDEDVDEAALLDGTLREKVDKEPGKLIARYRGMDVYRRPNGICAVRLHYSANPAHDEAWVKKTRAHVPNKWSWEQNYEINFAALSGEIVFDMWLDKAHVLNVPERPPANAKLYRALDSGFNAPAACLWIYVIEDKKFKGIFWHIVYRELYVRRMDAPSFARLVLNMSHDEVYKGTWADPAAFASTQASPLSVGDQWRRAGLRCHKALSNDDREGIHAISFGLNNTLVRFRGARPAGYCIGFSLNCPNTIREHSTAVFKTIRKDLTVSEEISGDIHTIDCEKYYLLSVPSSTYARSERQAAKIRRSSEDLRRFIRRG